MSVLEALNASCLQSYMQAVPMQWPDGPKRHLHRSCSSLSSHLFSSHPYSDFTSALHISYSSMPLHGPPFVTAPCRHAVCLFLFPPGHSLFPCFSHFTLFRWYTSASTLQLNIIYFCVCATTRVCSLPLPPTSHPPPSHRTLSSIVSLALARTRPQPSATSLPWTNDDGDDDAHLWRFALPPSLGSALPPCPHPAHTLCSLHLLPPPLLLSLTLPLSFSFPISPAASSNPLILNPSRPHSFTTLDLPTDTAKANALETLTTVANNGHFRTLEEQGQELPRQCQREHQPLHLWPHLSSPRIRTCAFF